MKIFLTLTLLAFSLYAKQFSVASYNVENLFDAKKSGYEFKEYIPYGKSGWSKKMYTIKIKNIARVIKDIDADIISLQEVENRGVLKRLNLALGKKKYPYMYSSFKSDKFDVVLLSRYPIKRHSSYTIEKRFRPIHRVVVDIDGFELVVFMNHWPSKRHSVETRMKYAKKLKYLYNKEKNYILLGDFNSPLKKQKGDWGKAVELVSQKNHNLWYDIPSNKRYSYKFFKIRSAIDHIIVSSSMFERYIKGSFKVHRYGYLVAKYGNANRWQVSQKGKGEHLGKGFSDHFAISAQFDTNKQKRAKPKPISIKELIKKDNGRVNLLLEGVMIVHKGKYGVVVEDKNGDTIYMHRPDFDFKLGDIHSLHVEKIGEYKGKKQIILVGFNSHLDKMGK